MSSEPGSGSWWTPSWRRLVGSSVVLFVVILALLVGRVRAGADPGLVRQTTQAPPPQRVEPTDPQGGQGVDPGSSSGGSTDNFGNAIPDDQGSSANGSDGSGQGSQSPDPPSTHVS
jgi:hypothetical protein